MPDSLSTLSVTPRRIIVCGSRSYADRQRVRVVLSEFVPPDPRADEPTILHGNCRGADKIAGEEALNLGLWVEPHPAQWSKHGKSAGPLRNREMADSGADLCIAFGDGKGTRDMITAAKVRGIPVRREP